MRTQILYLVLLALGISLVGCTSMKTLGRTLTEVTASATVRGNPNSPTVDVNTQSLERVLQNRAEGFNTALLINGSMNPQGNPVHLVSSRDMTFGARPYKTTKFITWKYRGETHNVYTRDRDGYYRFRLKNARDNQKYPLVIWAYTSDYELNADDDMVSVGEHKFRGVFDIWNTM